MKVLIAHNAYQSTQVGGEDVVVARETAALKKALGAHNVYTYFVSNDDIRPAKLVFTLWGDKQHATAIAELIQKEKIDIVHVHNFFPLLTPLIFQAAKQAGAKVVHTLHNYRWWCASGLFYRSSKANCKDCLHKSFAYPAIAHGCYRGSRLQSALAVSAFSHYHRQHWLDNIDAFFVLTEFQRNQLTSILPVDKLIIKPNFVDEASNIFAFKQKKHYLFVGRLEQAKGIDLLLSHWRQLPAHFQLKVVGANEKAYRAKYRLSNIEFLGKQPMDAVKRHMARAKYLIQPSLVTETFGLTIIEAMNEGTPVIGLDIGTRTELIQSGKTGFLTSPEGFLNTIKNSYDFAQYPTLCENARIFAGEFSKEKVINQQINHYQRLLSGAAHG